MAQKKYIHPILGRIVEHIGGGEYRCPELGLLTVEKFLALGFVELPTTDTGNEKEDIYPRTFKEITLDYKDDLEVNNTKHKDFIDYLWERHFKEDTTREKQGLRNQIESAMDIYPPKTVEPVGLEYIMKKISKVLWGSEYKRGDEYNDVYNILAHHIIGKQEQLAPLDVANVTQEIYEKAYGIAGYDYNPTKFIEKVSKILYKYGVPKQEEKIPSTIEELVDKLCSCVTMDKYNTKPEGGFDGANPMRHYVRYDKDKMMKILSSLSPIGKKRTREEVKEHFGIRLEDTIDNIPLYKRNQMVGACIFLKNHDLFQ